MNKVLEKIDVKKLGLVIIGLVGIILVFYLFNIIGTKLFSKSTYEEVESIMKNATISYYEDNIELLPSKIGETVEIDISSLIDAKYMKSIEKYTKDKKVTCSGSVRVTKINDNYRYNPILNCSDNYQTIFLVDYIKENVPIVQDGSGLYSINNQLVYRGDNVSNYATLGNKSYRIIKVAEEHVVLIYTGKIGSTVWDNRYNIDKSSKIGINDYSVSRIKEYMQEIYDSDTLFSDKEKLLLSSYSLPIGKRKLADTDKSGAIENATLFQNQYIGLLSINDYLNASLDANCTSSTSVSCVNYNYLMEIQSPFWTITADADTSYKVFKIDQSSGASLVNASSNANAQPVIYLVSDAKYISGDGSLNNPFQFE